MDSSLVKNVPILNPILVYNHYGEPLSDILFTKEGFWFSCWGGKTYFWICEEFSSLPNETNKINEPKSGKQEEE